MKPSDKTILDLYCGMGGLSSGFTKFFQVTNAVDLWKDACRTYHLNHKVRLHNYPVTEFLATCIPKDFEGMVFNGVVGGPPCQEFSVLNHNPDLDSVRARQLFVFLDAVKLVRPEFAMIENVASIPLRLKLQAAKTLQTQGYKVIHKVIHAFDYGSVQLRRRWVLTAAKQHYVYPETHQSHRSAQEILKNKHSYMKMSKRVSEQLQELPKGKWVSLPGKHWKEYFIVDPTKPLPAIVNVLKNRIVRPDCSGYVSLDEIKLAQGFSPTYKMYGTLTSKAQQLANAVPVELATSFAKAFFKAYYPDQNSLLHYLG